jgi:hypothetical protein
LEPSGEPLDQFLLGATERRTFSVVDHVMDREELTLGFEPPIDRPTIGLPVLGIDGAIQGVLENPIKRFLRGSREEIGVQVTG